MEIYLQCCGEAAVWMVEAGGGWSEVGGTLSQCPLCWPRLEAASGLPQHHHPPHMMPGMVTWHGHTTHSALYEGSLRTPLKLYY